MKKVFRTIEQDNGSLTFYGCNRWASLYQECAGDSDRYYFMHYGRKYYLDDFMTCRGVNGPVWMEEFDGYTNDTFFSGVVIVLSHNAEQVKAFTFVS